MPIEDVDYLRANSVKQSYVFLIDSKDRDKLAYRTPSEYVVDFEKPFENVVGLEVVDASIPRTMYNVDAYNNQLRFFIYTPDYNWDGFGEASWCNVFVETGDYTVQTLVPALNNQFSMRLNQSPTGSNVGITVETLSNPPDIKNKLKFYCPYPFLLDMSVSMAETLGFDVVVSPQESSATGWYASFDKTQLLTTPLKQQIWTRLPSKTNTEIIAELGLTVEQRGWLYFARDIYDNASIYKSVDKSFVLGDASTYGESITVFEGPRSVIRNYAITSAAQITQRFTVGAAVYLTSIQVAFTGPRESQYETILDTSAQYALYRLPKSALAPTVAAGRVLMASGNIGISAIDGSYSLAVLTQTCFLDPVWSYWLVLSNTDNQPLSVYYNNVTVNRGNPMLTTTNGGETWVSLDEVDIPYQVSCLLTGNYEFHEIVAPGIYNLVGEKYITLRCKEIEENSHRSLAYTRHNLGLAKFRLGVVGYSENRLDFSKVPLREFHPIGKLSRLSLRFDTAGGQLYDFKGVNHTITMSIHYLEPIQKVKFDRSILNPNYRGDFIEYRFREDDQEGDSDDQDDDFSRDKVGDYKKYEVQYHPETIRLQQLQRTYEIPRFQSYFNDENTEHTEDEQTVSEDG
jgi:hypothetical protein